MRDRPIHVLIVDDEESLRVPLAKWLVKEYGHIVETTADGEFVRVLERGRVVRKPVRVVSSDHTHLAVEGLDDGQAVLLAGGE